MSEHKPVDGNAEIAGVIRPGDSLRQMAQLPATELFPLALDLVNEVFDDGTVSHFQKYNLDQIFVFSVYLTALTASQLTMAPTEIAQVSAGLGAFFGDIVQAMHEKILQHPDVDKELALRQGLIFSPPRSEETVVRPALPGEAPHTEVQVEGVVDDTKPKQSIH